MADRPVYLTPQGLSDRLEGVISVKTLETWRWKRKGPAFVKAGGAVLYRLSDVEAWENAQRVTTRDTSREPETK